MSFTCTLIHVIVSQCLFIMLFSVAVICYYLVHTVYMHELFPFTHTLTRSLSDDPGFARPDIGRLFYCAGVRCDCTPCEELDSLSLLILVFLHFFILTITL